MVAASDLSFVHAELGQAVRHDARLVAVGVALPLTFMASLLLGAILGAQAEALDEFDRI